ncbi:MAG: GGDEF domain-containing protein [Gammaproteobacteria bacterium]|nr:GGDEF domain-containing protein [Gammaproteobacteria bacterium]
MFFIDLDDCKAINDDYGHHVGDEILRQAGSRLLGAVRESDTVARLAGDEFTVIADSPHDEAAAIQDKISACLLEPFEIGDRAIKVSASVGAAIYPDHGESLESLMQFADQSMYGPRHGARAPRWRLSRKLNPTTKGCIFRRSCVWRSGAISSGSSTSPDRSSHWRSDGRRGAVTLGSVSSLPGRHQSTDFMGLARRRDHGCDQHLDAGAGRQAAQGLATVADADQAVAINIAISQIKDPPLSPSRG